MSYREIKLCLNQFEEALRAIDIEIPCGSSIREQIAGLREYVQDRCAHDSEFRMEDWNNVFFKEYFEAMLILSRLFPAVVSFANHSGIKKRLKEVLPGPLEQGVASHAKNIFYELELGWVLQKAGFTIEIGEPDLTISGGGLSASYGIECKNPSSAKQIQEKITEGYRQLEKKDITGFVAIELEQICFSEACPIADYGSGTLADFGESLQEELRKTIKNIEQERECKLVNEKPLDGCLLTLTRTGLYGSPRGITTLHALEFQSDSKNPLYEDLDKIHRRVKSLKKL